MPTVNRKGKGSHTQSVLFAVEFWTKATSRKWLVDHDLFTDGFDAPGEGGKFLRWRQVDPEPNKFRYRNQVIQRKRGKPSIVMVQGFPKGSRPSSENGWMKTLADRLQVEVEIIQEEEMSGTSMTTQIKELMSTLAERDVAMVDLNTQIDALKIKVTEAVEVGALGMAEKDKLIDERDASIKTFSESVKELETQVSDLDAKLVEARSRLSHPAMNHAESDGEKTPAGDGGANTTDVSAMPHYDEFKSLRSDGQPRQASKYWVKHEKEIQAEMKAAVEFKKNSE